MNINIGAKGCLALSLDEPIRSIIANYKKVAIVGLSKDPGKDSYKVAEYLKSKGYCIVPVNPTATEILGERCYKSLGEIPEQIGRQIEVVDIFRPSQDVPSIMQQAIKLKQKQGKLRAIWMQLGIVNEDAAKEARAASLDVVMDRCMKIEHKKLHKP